MAPSATSWSTLMFRPFSAYQAAINVATGQRLRQPHDLYYRIGLDEHDDVGSTASKRKAVAALLQRWRADRISAARLGTAVHDMINAFFAADCNDALLAERPRHVLVDDWQFVSGCLASFLAYHKSLTALGFAIALYETVVVAPGGVPGTIDALYSRCVDGACGKPTLTSCSHTLFVKGNVEFHLVDWKTTQDVTTKPHFVGDENLFGLSNWYDRFELSTCDAL